MVSAGSQVAYLLIYVDDIILTASCPSLLQQIIGSLNNEFDMTDLGALNYFLSVFADRTPIVLNSSSVSNVVSNDECDKLDDPVTESPLDCNECLDEGVKKSNEEVLRSGISDNNEGSKKSYANATKSTRWYETNKMMFVSIVFTEIGNEVVVFDEEHVEIGSKKWELTLCGYLVGHTMSLPALSYHLRRMWSRFRFREIIDNGNGKWLFKFSNKQGMNKVEPTKIPVWVKLFEVPMEAWTVEGISAISSSVGRPLIMECKVRIRTEEEVAKEKEEYVKNMTSSYETGFVQNKFKKPVYQTNGNRQGANRTIYNN
ncbi:RNA-directed DNA polymerase, eukaryota, reverse transcriptase zinc-binding domain protein [Tanacetum coccineum]